VQVVIQALVTEVLHSQKRTNNAASRQQNRNAGGREQTAGVKFSSAPMIKSRQQNGTRRNLCSRTQRVTRPTQAAAEKRQVFQVAAGRQADAEVAAGKS